MSTGEKPPTTENGSAQDAPLTQEEYAAQLQRLIERGKAAGLKPAQTMIRTYARKVMSIFESALDALESDDSPKGKK